MKKKKIAVHNLDLFCSKLQEEDGKFTTNHLTEREHDRGRKIISVKTQVHH